MRNDLPQNLINKAILSQKTPSLCESWGRHFEHLSSNKLFLQSFELLASCDSLKCQILMFSFDFNTSITMKIVIFIVIFTR